MQVGLQAWEALPGVATRRQVLERRPPTDPTVAGFLGNLASGTGDILQGLGQFGAEALTNPVQTLTQTLPSLPGAIVDDYRARYGDFDLQDVYDNPAPYLFDVADVGALGYAGKRGISRLMDAPIGGLDGATRRQVLSPANEAGQVGGLDEYLKSISGPVGSRFPQPKPSTYKPLPETPGPSHATARPPAQLQPEAMARDLIYRYRNADEVKKAIIARVKTGEVDEASAARALSAADEIFADPTLQTGLDQRVMDFQDFQRNAPTANAGGTGGSPLLLQGPTTGFVEEMVAPEGVYGRMRHPSSIDRTPSFLSDAEAQRLPEGRYLTQDEVQELLQRELGREPTPAEVSEWMRTTPTSHYTPGKHGDLTKMKEAPPAYAAGLRAQLAPQHGPVQPWTDPATGEVLDFPASQRAYDEEMARAKGPQFSNPVGAMNEEVYKMGDRLERANADRFLAARPDTTAHIRPRSGSGEGMLQSGGTSLAGKRARAEQALESEAFPNPLDDAIEARRTLGELDDAELTELVDQAIMNRMESAQGLDALDGDLADAAVHASRILTARNGKIARQGGVAEEFSLRHGDPSRDVFTHSGESPMDPGTMAQILGEQRPGAVQPAPHPLQKAYQERAYAEDVGKVRRSDQTQAQKVTRRRLREEARRPAEQVQAKTASRRRSQAEKTTPVPESTSAQTVEVNGKPLTAAKIRKKLAHWEKEGVSNSYTAKLEAALSELEGAAPVAAPAPSIPSIEGPVSISPDDLLQRFKDGEITAAEFWELNRAATAPPAQAAANQVTDIPKRAASEAKPSSTKRKSAKTKGLVDIENTSSKKLKNKLAFRKSRGEDNEFTKAIEAELRKRGDL